MDIFFISFFPFLVFEDEDSSDETQNFQMMGSSRDLEQVVRLATSAHVFFTTLQQLMHGRQCLSPTEAVNDFHITNEIASRYFILAQALNHTMTAQKTMFLEVELLTLVILYKRMLLFPFASLIEHVYINGQCGALITEQ